MRGLTSAHPDFMLRFAQCTRGSKVRDESCGTDSVRMYGRRTPYEQSGGYNGIFPRLRPHREQCVGEPRATRRLTVYTEHRAGGRQSGRITALIDSQGRIFQKSARGSAHRTLPPHIFRDNGRIHFTEAGTSAPGMRRLCRTRRFGRNTGHYGSISPYVLGSYPARAGAVGDHVPIMTVYLKMRLGKHRHGGAVRE